MKSRSKLYVIARWHGKNADTANPPHSYLQVWGPFYTWQPGIYQHCRFDYEDCYRHYQVVTQPGGNQYTNTEQWTICGFIAPIREDTKS